jgi:hypothetical protein
MGQQKSDFNKKKCGGCGVGGAGAGVCCCWGKCWESVWMVVCWSKEAVSGLVVHWHGKGCVDEIVEVGSSRHSSDSEEATQQNRVSSPLFFLFKIKNVQPTNPRSKNRVSREELPAILNPLPTNCFVVFEFKKKKIQMKGNKINQIKSNTSRDTNKSNFKKRKRTKPNSAVSKRHSGTHRRTIFFSLWPLSFQHHLNWFFFFLQFDQFQAVGPLEDDSANCFVFIASFSALDTLRHGVLESFGHIKCVFVDNIGAWVFMELPTLDWGRCRHGRAEANEACAKRMDSVLRLGGHKCDL